MKNVKKKILTSALSTAFVLSMGGAIAFGTYQSLSAKAEGMTSFAVVEGASIRQAGGTTASGKEVKNGLRFMSELSVADYEALDDNGGVVNCGIFIMPYSYIADYGALNEANCFGAEAIYKWKDKAEASAETAKTILHMQSSAFKGKSESSEEEVYKIQGSVVNMLDENLDRDYVGVAYIAVTEAENTTYYFAKNYETNKRSPIQVAYNALNKESVPEETETIATSYVDNYVTYYNETNGTNPTRTINAEVYINSSNGYVKSETKSAQKEIAITSAADLTKDYAAADLDLNLANCTEIKGIKNDSKTTKLKLDNTATVKAYYDENQVDVLFDMSLDPDAVKNGTSAELPNNRATLSSGYSWQFYLEKVWGWHGGTSLWIQDFTSGGAYSTHINYTTPVQLTEATNTFSMMVKFIDTNYKDFTDAYSTPVWITDANGITYKSNFTIPIDLSLTSHEPVYAEVTFDSAISSVKTITFPGQSKGTTHFYVDYICAEYLIVGGIVIGGENTTVNGDKVTVSGDSPVTVQTNQIFSTVYNSEELVSPKVSVSAKKFVNQDTLKNGATGETKDLVATETGYTLTAKNNYYTLYTEISYTLNGESKTETKKYTVFGYHENVVQNFDTDITAGENPVATPMNDGSPIWLLGGVGTGVDGSYSADCRFGYGRIWNLNCANIPGFKITGECTKVSFWVGNRYWWIEPKNPLNLLGANAFGVGYSGINLGLATNDDWVYVEIDLASAITQEVFESSDKIFAITGCDSSTSVGGYYVDNIALK